MYLYIHNDVNHQQLTAYILRIKKDKIHLQDGLQILGIPRYAVPTGFRSIEIRSVTYHSKLIPKYF